MHVLYLFSRGLSLSDVMWLESVTAVTILVLEVPTGMLADAVGRRASLVASQAVALLGWVPFLLAGSMPVFAIASFLAGVSYCLGSGADQALVYEALDAEGRAGRMQWFMGRMGAAAATAGAVAGAVGGLVASGQVDLERFRLLYAVTIAAQVVGLLLLLTVREPRAGTAGTAGSDHHVRRRSPVALLRAGVRAVRTDPALRRVALLSACSPPFAVVLGSVYQPYFAASGVPVALFGVVLAAGQATTVVAGLTAHRLEGWFGPERAVLVATMAPALGWLVMSVAFSPVLAPLAYLATRTVADWRAPLFAGLTNRHITGPSRATVLSLISVMAAAYNVVARPVVGYAADVSLPAAFVLTAALIAVGAWCFRPLPGRAPAVSRPAPATAG